MLRGSQVDTAAQHRNGRPAEFFSTNCACGDGLQYRLKRSGGAVRIVAEECSMCRGRRVIIIERIPETPRYCAFAE